MNNSEKDLAILLVVFIFLITVIALMQNAQF